MLTLAAPLGLAALAALAVPLALHLVRRADQRVISFAAMRFLRERRHPRDEWRVDRWLLLALRCALIAGLAVLLASPLWPVSGDGRPPWVIVVPGVYVVAARAAVPGPPAEWHWLAEGFPSLQASPIPPPMSAPASLLRQLDAELPAAVVVTVLVPPQLGGLDAERLRLRRKVEWRIVTATPPPDSIRASVPAKPSGSAVAPRSRPLKVSVRYDAAGAAELPVVRAFAAAWSVAGMHLEWDTAQADTPNSGQRVAAPAGTNWLFWLDGPITPPLRDWVRRGGTLLASRAAAAGGEAVLTDADGTVLFRSLSVGSGRLVTTALPLSTAAMPALLDPTLAGRLLEVLNAPLLPPDRAQAATVTPLPQDAQAEPAGPTRRLSTDLAATVALLFLIERLWATRRVRPRGPRP